MQCSCGGEMKQHTVQKDLKDVGTFYQCVMCGRIKKSVLLESYLKGLEKKDVD